MTGWRLVTALCVAHVLSLTGFSAFAALLPTHFFAEWGISGSQAGLISGVFFAAYAGAVLVLASATDRIDSRRVYLTCAAVGVLACLGFAFLAAGFWSALLWRAFAGLALAGTYMPGLKVLTDRYEGSRQSRALAFYTASFALGASLSYVLAGQLAPGLGWRWTFTVLALGPLSAFAIVALAARPLAPQPSGEASGGLLDFRPVLRNRPAMAYILGYGAHCWELMAMRSWIVAFLAFSQGQHPDGLHLWRATTIAAAVNLVGVASSILGNELAMRFGRRRYLIVAMLASAALAATIGFTAALPMTLVVGLSLAYGVLVMADSAALIAGAIQAADEGRRGATMAILSFIGFTGSFLGPLAFGVVLDLAGGRGSVLAWGLAFTVLGLGCLAGVVALRLLGREARA